MPRPPRSPLFPYTTLFRSNGLTIADVCVPAAPDPSWQIVGTGDFDGDGLADIVFRHTSGAVAIWLMDGCEIVDVGVPAAPRPSSRIVCTRGFDWDGLSYIV